MYDSYELKKKGEEKTTEDNDDILYCFIMF